MGDPCWDVGSALSGYLGFWVLSIPTTGDNLPNELLEFTQYPLSSMQPAIRAFWQSYMRRMEFDAVTSDRWLLRAIKYGAARLVQTACEQMQMSAQFTDNVVCFLQLSHNIMQRPQEAIAQLLGIPLQRIGS